MAKDNQCHELKNGSALQPMYGIRGEHEFIGEDYRSSRGYCQSHPVRIGNGAYKQQQLGIYGEFMDAIAIYNRYDAITGMICGKCGERLLEWLSQHWHDTDEGIWEVRRSKKLVNSQCVRWLSIAHYASRQTYPKGGLSHR